MWKLFNDQPTWRDLNIKLNQTGEFHLMFCSTRWVEDALVTSRAMAVQKNVVKVVQHYQSLSKFNQPKDNTSYDHLVKYADLIWPNMWRHGVVVLTTAQLRSTELELRFCAGSNPARGMSEIHNGEDL